jgi:hypothetical protein
MNIVAPMTASDLIDALGGNRGMAAIAGVLPTAVSNWRKIGRIPPRLYLPIAAAGRARGVAVPEGLFLPARDDERRAQPEAAA